MYSTRVLVWSSYKYHTEFKRKEVSGTDYTYIVLHYTSLAAALVYSPSP